MRPEQFDLGYWTRVLGTMPPDSDSLREIHTDSPISAVLIERYRELACAVADLGPRVPVTRVIFGFGEGTRRSATKVNGLPFRPRGKRWPLDCEGRPMAFLAQFNFDGMENSVGQLPGVVLLVFVRMRPALVFGGFYPEVDPEIDPHSLAFEWYPLALSDLTTSDEIPPVTVVFPTCVGFTYQSWDYLDNERVAEILRRVIPEEILSTDEHFRRATLGAISRHRGMKMGGAPLWLQQSTPPIDGRFLGSFTGVELAFTYPWVNRSESLTLDTAILPENHLYFRDGCRINFFLRDDGTVGWISDFC